LCFSIIELMIFCSFPGFADNYIMIDLNFIQFFSLSTEIHMIIFLFLVQQITLIDFEC
jgi:hypothetical protein